MISRLIHHFKKYKKIIGLEILIRPDQSYTFNAIVLERKKSKIEILDRLTNLNSIQELSSLKSLPVAVLINGKSVLNKKLTDANTLANNPIADIIPNVNPADFSYEIHSVATQHWISIIRKDLLTKIIESFSVEGLQIVDLSIGFFGVQHILPLINTNPEVIQTTAFSIHIVDDEINDFSLRENEDLVQFYQIGEDNLDYQLLLPFSKAFANLIGAPSVLSNTVVIAEEEEKFLYSNLFEKLKWAGLIGIFGVLVVNFLLFTYFNNKNQKSGIQLSMYQSQLDQLGKLKNKFQEKQMFFKQSSILEPSKISWYADQLGASIEQGIELQQLTIAPLINKEKRRIDHDFLFDQEKIMIKGNSVKSVHLNTWIKSIQQINWVKEVNVLPYSEGSNGFGAFELEVLIEPSK